MLALPPTPSFSVFTLPPDLASRAWLTDSGGHVPEPLANGWDYVAGSFQSTMLTLTPLPARDAGEVTQESCSEKANMPPSPPPESSFWGSCELEAVGFSLASLNHLLSSFCPRSWAPVHTQAGRGRSDLFSSQHLMLRCCSQHPLQP